MWIRVKVVAWKEFLQILRDWRTLTVVLVLPVVMLTIYGYAINFDLKHLPIGIRDDDRTAASRDLAGAFAASPYFDIRANHAGQGETDLALSEGLVKAVLSIPRGYADDLSAGRVATVALLVDGSDSTTASTGIAYAEAIIQERSAAVTIEAVGRKGIVVTGDFVPLEIRSRHWYNPEQRSVNYIVPGLLAVIMMMMAALLTSLTVVRERERGTIEQLIVSPLRSWELMLGKLIPYVIIAYVDVVLIIGAGRLLFKVPVAGSMPLLLAMTGIFLTASLGVGLLISVVSPTQQTAMTFAMLAAQLPSLLLSGFIFPIAAMPPLVRAVTNIVPTRHFLVIVRGIFLKGVGLEVFWRQALILLAYGIVVLGLASLKFRKKL
jgi:ABC-2 type transport system permease protein